MFLREVKIEIKWIEHKGKKILYIDHRGAKDDDEMLKILKQAEELQKKEKGEFCALGNVKGAELSDKYIEELKKIRSKYGSKSIKKFALLGVAGLRKMVLNGYLSVTGEKKMKCFDKEEEAKEWLAE